MDVASILSLVSENCTLSQDTTCHAGFAERNGVEGKTEEEIHQLLDGRAVRLINIFYVFWSAKAIRRVDHQSSTIPILFRGEVGQTTPLPRRGFFRRGANPMAPLPQRGFLKWGVIPMAALPRRGFSSWVVTPLETLPQRGFSR